MKITKENIEYTQSNLCLRICPNTYKRCSLVSDEYTYEEQWHNICGCPVLIAWRFKN